MDEGGGFTFENADRVGWMNDVDYGDDGDDNGDDHDNGNGDGGGDEAHEGTPLILGGHSFHDGVTGSCTFYVLKYT